jgi:hypothetical protein
MNSLLNDIIPASQRKRVYALLALAALVFATVSGLGVEIPTWLKVVSGVVTAIVAKTAGANVNPEAPAEPEVEAPAQDWE